MNIAHIIPRSITYPLKLHNGRYDWVRQLALLQTKDGHTVTIYGDPDSSDPGLSFDGLPEASTDTKQDNLSTFRLAFGNYHDVYHSHFDNLHYEVAHETSKPLIFTQHWWPTQQTINLAQKTQLSNVWAVPPTNYMYNFDLEKGIRAKDYIYHGIDLNIYRRSTKERTGRMLFVGRISPEKNLESAISAALNTGSGLDIVGKIASKNQAYWDSLQPLIDGVNIRYHGPKTQAELVDFYSTASGVLCPFDTTEAFGLVAIEAQACGTPVIMKRGGSRGELVQEAKTGFLFENEDEFFEAIGKLATLKVDDCAEFARKFDATVMAKKYIQMYKCTIA